MILTNLNACTEAKDWLCFLGHLQCHLDIDKRQEKTKTIEDISKQKSKIILEDKKHKQVIRT